MCKVLLRQIVCMLIIALAGYLLAQQTNSDQSSNRTPIPTISFDQIVFTAVNLEKQHAWYADAGKKAREQYAGNADALRYLDSLRLLLGGDTNGITRLFDGTPPDYRAWGQATGMLQMNGFELAANVFILIGSTGQVAFGWQDPAKVEEGVRCWLLIPADKAGPVDQVMYQRLAQSPMGEGVQRFYQAAMRLYEKNYNNRKMKPGPAEFFALALRIGADRGFFQIKDLQEIKPPEYQVAAQYFLNKDPGNVSLWRYVFYLDPSALDQQACYERYQQAMKIVKEPGLREIRMDYLDFQNIMVLRKTPGTGINDLQTWQTNADPLIAADALYMAEKFAEAQQRYKKVLDDKRQSLERRCYAWSGLMNIDPLTAMKAGNQLVDELEKRPIADRAPLASWMAWDIWTDVAYAVDFSRKSFNLRWEQKRKLVTAVPECLPLMAAVVPRLLAMDEKGLLTPDWSTREISYRIPAATIYAMAGQPDAAAAILVRPTEYQIPPPPGGWRDDVGRLKPDGDKPKLLTYRCRYYDIQSLMNQVLSQKRGRPTYFKMAGPYLWCLSGEIKSANDWKVFDDLCIKFGEFLEQLAKAIEEDTADASKTAPAPVEVDLSMFPMIEKAMREGLSSEFAAGRANVAANAAIRGIFFSKSPKLREAMFSLYLIAVDRSLEIEKDPAKRKEKIEMYAKSLEAYKNMADFADRFRKQYQ